jgi:type IV secretory pathway VirB3-like protein
MASLQDFSLPVHKSLQQPDLLLGIPKPVIALILCMTMILVYLLGFVFSLCGIILYIPCYFLSKEDPDLLIIALNTFSLIIWKDKV